MPQTFLNSYFEVFKEHMSNQVWMALFSFIDA